jgi:hypothetical protein
LSVANNRAQFDAKLPKARQAAPMINESVTRLIAGPPKTATSEATPRTDES